MPIHRPFFSFYGSKFRIAPLYPEPKHDLIIEPFAGSASYALRWWWHKVTISDIDPILFGVWDFLIRAKREEILSLPDLEAGNCVDDLNIPQEAKWLIGFWLNRGMQQPAKTMSKWGRSNKYPYHFWNTNARNLIVRQQRCIRHWRVENKSYETVENRRATWFIDPPYCSNSGAVYRFNEIDFNDLSRWCQTRLGQTIVCEHNTASWLPFREMTRTSSTYGHDGLKKKSTELFWTSD